MLDARCGIIRTGGTPGLHEHKSMPPRISRGFLYFRRIAEPQNPSGYLFAQLHCHAVTNTDALCLGKGAADPFGAQSTRLDNLRRPEGGMLRFAGTSRARLGAGYLDVAYFGPHRTPISEQTEHSFRSKPYSVSLEAEHELA